MNDNSIEPNINSQYMTKEILGIKSVYQQTLTYGKSKHITNTNQQLMLITFWSSTWKPSKSSLCSAQHNP